MNAVFAVKYFAYGWRIWAVCASREAAERELVKCRAEWPGHETSVSMMEVVQ